MTKRSGNNFTKPEDEITLIRIFYRSIVRSLYKKLTDPIFDRLIQEATMLTKKEVVCSSRAKTDKEIFITYCISKCFTKEI